MKKTLFLLMLLVLSSGWSWACGPEGPDYDAYIFRLCQSPLAYSRNNDQRLADAWSTLVGKKVTVAQSRQLAELNLSDLDTLSSPIGQYARKSKEVGDYLRLLVSYLQTARFSFDGWNYPTPEEIARYNRELESQLAQASAYQGNLLFERYYFLRFRILFRQSAYSQIISIWEKSPLKGNSVFADLARDYYAGALFHLGRQEEGAVQYAISGNMYDARQCMRYMRGVQCIAKVVEKDPNSPVLPYMVEEFVNGCAEAYKYYNMIEQMRPFYQSQQCIPWKQVASMNFPFSCVMSEGCPDDQLRISRLLSLTEWFQSVRAYEVSKDEIKLFENIIESQLSNRSVQDRCMWMSAKAYLHYLKNDYSNAWDYIQQAVKLSGSQYSSLNARYLLMLISTRQPNLKVMERVLIKGLPEFMTDDEMVMGETSADGSYTYYDFDNRSVSNLSCLNHLVKYGIVDRYIRQGDSVMAAMSWSLLCEKYGDIRMYLPSYGGEHYQALQSLSFTQQQELLSRISQPSGKQSDLLKFICNRLPFERADYIDIIGTRLLCDGRFAEAISYLEQVPLDFISHQPIAPYAAIRNFRDYPWNRPDVDIYGENTNVRLTTNAKVDYCREVLKQKEMYASSTGEARCEAAYNLGALLHQASAIGSCWYLAYYYVSTSNVINLGLSNGHYDFIAHSREYLKYALTSTTNDLRYKAYFLLLSQGHDNLLNSHWNDNYTEFITELNTKSPYYPILRQFKMDLYGKPGQPDFVSNCDDIYNMYALMK